MIDLHTHSTASDGTDSPARLVEVAARSGITTLAITDHDTASGWPEAAEAAGRHQVGLVRGAEISAFATAPGFGTGVHLLAYLHDPTHPGLLAESERTRDDRESRARRMVDLLAEDFPITWDDLLAQTQSGTTIGRPHIADALAAAGVVRDREEAFATMLHPGTRYYVGHYAPGAVHAVRAVRAAGGVPVLAHPGAGTRGLVVPDVVIEELAAEGLAGLEVDHRDHTPDMRRHLRELAGSLDLLVTGSSDFHGAAGKPNRIGENTTAPEVLEAIAEQGALEVLR